MHTARSGSLDISKNSPLFLFVPVRNIRFVCELVMVHPFASGIAFQGFALHPPLHCWVINPQIIDYKKIEAKIECTS